MSTGRRDLTVLFFRDKNGAGGWLRPGTADFLRAATGDAESESVEPLAAPAGRRARSRAVGRVGCDPALWPQLRAGAGRRNRVVLLRRFVRPRARRQPLGCGRQERLSHGDRPRHATAGWPGFARRGPAGGGDHHEAAGLPRTGIGRQCRLPPGPAARGAAGPRTAGPLPGFAAAKPTPSAAIPSGKSSRGAAGAMCPHWPVSRSGSSST